ncbi:uncharacterized protein CCOS01_08939 [Colletotrichum costaricense]|uniref:Uncharacterized protein n=1 Tax=Colletotrichum costaricense TaxID=1209916 RepID=A0AAI9YUF6_9PEZI|nr:uncharacterized protein CCOS01_08939 [Colletotrichum costaricense]KAK1523852.1 hypothetical protein CCOS01_08939 [Colletotrichum costaricense]
MVNCEKDAKNLTEPDIMGFGISLYLSRVFIINVFDAKEREDTRVASTNEIQKNSENSGESHVALNAHKSSTTHEPITRSESSRRSNTGTLQVDGIDREETNIRGQFNPAGGQDSGLPTPGRSRTSQMESGATVSLFLLSYIFRLLLMWEFCLITTEHLC